MATKIYTSDLKVGMFVADLDRPWVDTPFLLQGFLIEEQEQIATLRTHCEFVIVDRARSVGDEFQAPKVGDISAPKVVSPRGNSITLPSAKGAAATPKDSPTIPRVPSQARHAPAREGKVLRLEDVTRRAGSRGPVDAPPSHHAEGGDGMLGRMVSGF
jgi:hypothetical protein